MTENQKQHGFASPKLNWLHNYRRSYPAFPRTAFTQNLLTVPASQDNGNTNLGKSSPYLSRRTSPDGKGTNIQNKLRNSATSVTSSIVIATAVAPIERVYIMMQCQNEMIKSGRLSTPYNGMTDCFRRTIKREGVISLWRGNSLNVITLCLHWAFPVAMFARLPYMDYMIPKMKESPVWILPVMVTPIMLYQYPLEYARVRLANDVQPDGKLKPFTLDLSRNTIGKRQFNGVIDVYKKTLQLDGIHGLYRGFSVSCIGLWTHYYMKKIVRPPSSNKEKNNQKKPRMSLMRLIMVLGMLNGVKIGLYPIDTVRRRMMMTSGEASKYRGAMDAFYQIVKTEGVSSLFKGATPFMIHLIAKDLVMFGLMYTTFLSLQKRAK